MVKLKPVGEQVIQVKRRYRGRSWLRERSRNELRRTPLSWTLAITLHSKPCRLASL